MWEPRLGAKRPGFCVRAQPRGEGMTTRHLKRCASGDVPLHLISSTLRHLQILEGNPMNSPLYASHRLRTGRWSCGGQIYLVTTVTKNRAPVFAELSAARTLINIIRQDERLGSHQTLCFVVMPDDLHWLLELRQAQLSQLVGRVKSLSAKRLGKPIWQKGFHDHALRQEEDIQRVARYVVANPLRAGLVTTLADYPHWDAVWM